MVKTTHVCSWPRAFSGRVRLGPVGRVRIARSRWPGTILQVPSFAALSRVNPGLQRAVDPFL